MVGQREPVEAQPDRRSRQVRKAVRIETGVAVPASAFAVPAGIEIQADEKAAKESRELARTMIESLGKLDEQP